MVLVWVDWMGHLSWSFLLTKRGIVWPKSVAPFAGAFGAARDSGRWSNSADELYENCAKLTLKFSTTTATCGPGDKFADATSSACRRWCFSEKTVAENKCWSKIPPFGQIGLSVVDGSWWKLSFPDKAPRFSVFTGMTTLRIFLYFPFRRDGIQW